MIKSTTENETSKMGSEQSVVKFDPISMQYAPSSENFVNLPPNSNRYFAPGISSSIQKSDSEKFYASFRLDSNPVEIAPLDYNALIGHYIHESHMDEFVVKNKIEIAHFNTDQIATSEIMTNDFNKEEKQDMMRYVVATTYHKSEVHQKSEVILQKPDIIQQKPESNQEFEKKVRIKNYCPKCGARILQLNQNFCSKCGASLN